MFYYETPRSYNIVMAYAANGTLRRAIEVSRILETPFELTILCKVFVQLVCGCAYLHQHGVIVRDLKPSAVAYDSSFHVKICAFDRAIFLSRPLAHNLSIKSKSAGLSNYAAPEVLLGEYFNEKADVYSIGAIISVIAKLPNASYPADLSNLCEAMTKYEPKKRISLPEVIQQPWFQQFLKKPTK